MGNFFRFLTSRTLLINIIVAIILGITGFFLVNSWLKSLTHHGEKIAVPTVRGLLLEKGDQLLAAQKLGYEIIDSLYVVGQKPGVILEQDPAPESKVKEGRTIYLTINAFKPPNVKMPNLIDVSHRQAEAILNSFGLKAGEIDYKPDLAKNAVLEQRYKGRSILPGKEIPKGSVIDLVLGDGQGTVDVEVPDLTGLTREEALFVLKGSSLNLGNVEFDEDIKDTSKARVYKQVPDAKAGRMINHGTTVDIYLQ